MSMSGSGCSILMPSARMACTVRRQSSLGRKPRRTQTPLVNPPRMTARCEMLLSPGTAISASMRGARLMRNSMSDAQHRDNSEACPAPLRSLSHNQDGYASASGNEEDFLRVGVFDLGPWWETADIHVTGIRRVRARDKTGLVRNG